MHFISLFVMFVEREKATALSTPDLQKKIDEYINMSTATVRTAQVMSTCVVCVCVYVCMYEWYGSVCFLLLQSRHNEPKRILLLRHCILSPSSFPSFFLPFFLPSFFPSLLFTN